MTSVPKILVIVVLGSVFQYVFLNKLSIDSSLIQNLVTFFSIIFGFYVTSLAIFATSRYVSNLYNLTDKNNKNQTLLQTLLQNYRFGLSLTLFSVFYLLAIEFFLTTHTQQNTTIAIPVGNIFLIPLLGIIISNFWYSYKMLDDSINIVIQEAKSNAESQR